MNLATTESIKDAFHKGVIAMRPEETEFERKPKDGKPAKKFVGRRFKGIITLEDGRQIRLEILQENGKPVFTTTPARSIEGKEYPAGDVIFMNVSIPKKQGGVL